jgi:hypothetical protein
MQDIECTHILKSKCQDDFETILDSFRLKLDSELPTLILFCCASCALNICFLRDELCFALFRSVPYMSLYRDSKNVSGGDEPNFRGMWRLSLRALSGFNHNDASELAAILQEASPDIRVDAEMPLQRSMMSTRCVLF